jgi:glycosyltransferase involved in cell wall biosynthesis
VNVAKVGAIRGSPLIMDSEKQQSYKVCFGGSARYDKPLDATDRKKIEALGPLGEIFVIGFYRGLLPKCFIQHARFYLLPELPFSFVRYIEMSSAALILMLWLIFRHNVQVLVAQSPYEGVAAATAKKIARVFGRRIVLVVEGHGDFEQDLFGQRRIVFPGFYRFLMRRAVRFTLEQADILRTISSSTRQQLERLKPDVPMFQFATWTDIEVFLQEGSGRGNEGSQTFIYAGVLIPRKGVLHLIHAFAEICRNFPAAKLVIIGKEQDRAYTELLKRQIAENGIQQRVEFAGELSQHAMADRMVQACCFVLPSLSEGLGRVVIEAMAAGLPVIGSQVGGIPDMIEEGKTGFCVPPHNEEVLAEKMRWMLEHPAEVQNMGRAAHTFARSFFSTESYVNGYQDILRTAQQCLKNGSADASPSV